MSRPRYERNAVLHFFHDSSQFFRMGAAEEMAGFCAAVHKTLRIFSSQYLN
jgi:hypothetical protein